MGLSWCGVFGRQPVWNIGDQLFREAGDERLDEQLGGIGRCGGRDIVEHREHRRLRRGGDD